MAPVSSIPISYADLCLLIWTAGGTEDTKDTSAGRVSVTTTPPRAVVEVFIRSMV